jgi:hypothetical protein
MAKTSFIHDMVDTWNRATEKFTAIKMDVTDTASTADSLLLDLCVDGASKFSVDKNGNLVSGGSQIPVDLTFAYNLDGTVSGITGTGVDLDFTYNLDGTLDTFDNQTNVRTFSYNPDGTISQIQVT